MRSNRRACSSPFHTSWFRVDAENFVHMDSPSGVLELDSGIRMHGPCCLTQNAKWGFLDFRVSSPVVWGPGARWGHVGHLRPLITGEITRNCPPPPLRNLPKDSQTMHAKIWTPIRKPYLRNATFVRWSSALAASLNSLDYWEKIDPLCA